MLLSIFLCWFTCGSLETVVIYNNENNMVDKNKLSKDVEEQIQSLASDVYIQVEEKLTHLITTAVKAEINKNTDQQSKALSVKEESLQKDFSEQQKLQAKEVAQLKATLAEKQADEATNKQNFQVELTQNSINYNETIERLEKQLVNAKQQNTQQQGDKQDSTQKLEEKLLETEQKLNDKTQDVDGLNGRIMVLTEQEQSLTMQLNAAKDKIIAVEGQQADSLSHTKDKAQAEANQQIDAFAEKLQHAQNEVARVKSEAQQNTNDVCQELQKKITLLTEEVKQEHNSKTELQQQLTALQKTLDTAQDKSVLSEQENQAQQAQSEQKNQAQQEQSEQQKQEFLTQIAQLKEQSEQQKQKHQEEIIKLNEQSASDKQEQNQKHQAEVAQLKEKSEQQNKNHQVEIDKLNEQAGSNKQQHLDDIKAINEAAEQAKEVQEIAQQKIIDLEKANEQLSKQVETEQNDIKLYQQEVSVLNDQVKVAQDGQENILKRFNTNRDKQEQENNQVRETIKFLRDENHELTSAIEVQKTESTEKVSELELKLTEYRLKFEYAQKQLAN